MNSVRDLMKFALEMFRPPKMQNAAEWATDNMVLVSESSSAPGRWNPNFAPYQTEIMEAFTQPGVWKIVVMSPAQAGKTTMMLIMMGRAIDLDPGPMLMVQPSVETAGDFSKQRITPMVKAVKVLSQKVFEEKSRDSGNTIYGKSFAGGYLALVGANAPAGLASRPIRYLFMDEVDRYPKSAGIEGDPVKLAEKRTVTFRHNRKIVMTSTPTIKGVSKIYDAYLSGTQEEWQTKCPHCGEYSYIQFNDIKFHYDKIENDSGEQQYTVTDTRWRCPLCGEETGEYDVKRQPGKWVSKNPQALQNGIRSFWPNAFMSPWSDWKEIALEFLNARKDITLLQTFHNLTLGEVWELNPLSEVSEMIEALLSRRETYRAQVPDGVLVLTMGVDTQDNRLEYEVVGWDRDEQSWGIERGILTGRADMPEVWQEFDNLLDRTWKRRDGTEMRISATFVDSGGHHTDSVYVECAKRAARRVYPIKGEGGSGRPYVRPMKTGGALRHGNMGFMIGVDAGKEAIMYSTNVLLPGPKYMHYSDKPEAGYDAAYFKGLMSEKPVVKHRAGVASIVWQQIVERNEPLDMRNYARAAYKYFHWNFDKIEAALRGEDLNPPITKAEAQRRKPKRIVSKGIQV